MSERKKGVEAVAEMLAVMDAEGRAKLLANLAARDPGLVQELNKRMFTFEDLTEIEPLDLQLLLRGVANDLLALAIKTCTDDQKRAFYGAISARGGELLRLEVEALGQRRLSEVRAAQDKILLAARELEAAGTIRLVRRREAP